MTDQSTKKRKALHELKIPKKQKRLKIDEIEKNIDIWRYFLIDNIKPIFLNLDSETLRNVLSFQKLFIESGKIKEITNIGRVFWNFDFWYKKIKQDYNFQFGKVLDEMIQYAKTKNANWDETNKPDQIGFWEKYKDRALISKMGTFYFWIANFYDHMKNRFFPIPNYLDFMNKMTKYFYTWKIRKDRQLTEEGNSGYYIDNIDILNDSPTTISFEVNLGCHKNFKVKKTKDGDIQYQHLIWDTSKELSFIFNEFPLKMGKSILNLKSVLVEKRPLFEGWLSGWAAGEPLILHSLDDPNKKMYRGVTPIQATFIGNVRATEIFHQNFNFDDDGELRKGSKLKWWDTDIYFNFFDKLKINNKMQIPFQAFNHSEFNEYKNGILDNIFMLSKLDFVPIDEDKGFANIKLTILNQIDLTILKINNLFLNNYTERKMMIHKLTVKERKLKGKKTERSARENMQLLFLFGKINFLRDIPFEDDNDMNKWTAYEFIHKHRVLDKQDRLKLLFNIIEQNMLVRARKNILFGSTFNNVDFCHNRSCYKKFSSKIRPMVCGSCLKNLYCSKECQIEDWDHNHQMECNNNKTQCK